MPRNNVLDSDKPSGTVRSVALKRFTVSLEEELIDAIREAAKAEGMSQAAFMAEAAQDRVRNWKLRVAIQELDPFDEDEANRLVTESFKPDFWTLGGK